MILEHFRKANIYFKKWDTYWKLTSENELLKVEPGNSGRYPLDFKPRITEGHYPYFDKNGVPMWPKSNGNGHFYHYTTMLSYALGQSDYYLLTGREEHLHKVLAVADYIIESGVEENGGIYLKEVDENDRHTGNVSAMSQGEAMSVLCRASEYSSENKYSKAAELLLIPFEKSTEEGGVLGSISRLDSVWYEEYVTKPLNHVLNGMVYSLWGLRDLFQVTENRNAKELFNNGVNYVGKALPYFDTGYWTYYWIPESGRNYVASMMYHNLHICQLRALFQQTGKDIFIQYADKFKEYAFNPLNRFKAAKAIALAKIRK